MRTVAALYIDPRGPYPGMEGVDCWDEARDATTYGGSHPIIAHPPCGPWGQLRALCRYQRRDLAPRAVAQVRRWGGVLEHPRGSLLWKEHDLALLLPGVAPDRHGGFTISVEQVAWGHACRKPTWLYLVGVDLEFALAGVGHEPFSESGRGASANSSRWSESEQERELVAAEVEVCS